METPKEKVIQLINKELEENYELINDEKNYYHDDIQAVKIQTNFLAKMLLEVEEIPDNEIKLQKNKEEFAIQILKKLKTKLDNMGMWSYCDKTAFDEEIESLIQKHKQ